MAIYIGDKKIGSLSLGGVGIREAYVGSTCVYRTEIVRTYQTPVITAFYYYELNFKAGSTKRPILKFTQDWTDNYGNSGTLTEETTQYTAEYSSYNAGGETNAFHLGENGEVITDNRLVGGSTTYIGSVIVNVTANGLSRGASAGVYQQSRPADIVDPVVSLDETLFQEASGSSTKKVYFNIDVTMNSALSVTPKYFLDSAGNQYTIITQSVTHDSTSSSGTTTTQYWAELPYTGDAANYTFRLWCEFTFDTGEGDRGYVATDTDDVQSSNFLVIDTSGDFYVR